MIEVKQAILDIGNLEIQDKLEKIFKCFKRSIDIFEKEHNGAFQLIKNKDLSFERIAWVGYILGIISASGFEYCESHSYGKVLINDKIGYFKDWLHRYFFLSREDKNYVPFLTFYKQFHVIGFFERNKDKDVEYVTFDNSNPESVAGMRFLEAKKAFDIYIRNTFGTNQEVFALYEKYFKIGNKLMPINYNVETCFSLINGSKSIRSIATFFRKRGLEIKNAGAERLRLMLRGLENDRRIYRRPVYLNSSIFAETDSFICCFEIKKKVSFNRTIPKSRRSLVLENHNFHILNHGKSCLDTEDKGVFYNAMRQKQLERLSIPIDDKTDYSDLKWKEVSEFNFNRGSGFVFHHLVAFNNLKNIEILDFDPHDACLLVPLLSWEHQEMHRVCGSSEDGVIMQYLVDNYMGEQWGRDTCKTIYNYIKRKERESLGSTGSFSMYIKEQFQNFL